MPAEPSQTIAVIGAGIAGLTCAHVLQEAGRTVTVYEREAEPGGRMSTRRRDGFSFDLGANFLIRSYESIGALAQELGVKLHNLSPVPHAVFREGAFHTMNFVTLRDVLRLDYLGYWSKVKFVAFVLALRRSHPDLDFFDLSRNPDELDLEDAYTYAQREIGQDFADYILDAFHTCMMFYRSRESTAATFLSLFQMRTDGRSDFSILHAEGEMRQLPQALAARLRVRLGCPVLSLERVPEGWRLVTPHSSRTYGRVVLATTASVAHALLPDDAPGTELLRQARYAATVNLSFRIPMGALGKTHCFYIPYRESSIVSEFTNEALKGNNAIVRGESLVNVGLHEEAARRLMNLADEELFGTVKAELVKLHSGLASAVPHDLQRWLEAIPKYDAEHVGRVKSFLQDGQGRDEFYLCGDYMNSPWLEGASRCGRRVAARILEKG